MIRTALFTFALAATAWTLPMDARAQVRTPPPEAGDLEGGENLPPPRRDDEIPKLTPETAAGSIKPLPPELPDRTLELLGDTTIVLDIPLKQIPNYREDMRRIVEDLGIYARKRNPNFTLITFGGFELLNFSQREFDLAEIKKPAVETTLGDAATPVGYPMRRYTQAVNGVILDGFFCAPLRVPEADVVAARGENVKTLSIDHCHVEQVPAAFIAAARSNVVAHVDADFDMPFKKQFRSGRPTVTAPPFSMPLRTRRRLKAIFLFSLTGRRRRRGTTCWPCSPGPWRFHLQPARTRCSGPPSAPARAGGTRSPQTSCPNRRASRGPTVPSGCPCRKRTHA